MKSSVDNDGEFELDALGRSEPVETGESICNMPRATLLTQWLKLRTSNLVHSLGLPRLTIKSHPDEKWAWT